MAYLTKNIPLFYIHLSCRELNCKRTSSLFLTFSSIPPYKGWVCHWAACLAYGDGGCRESGGLVWSEGNSHHPQLPRGTLKSKTWDNGSGLLKLTTAGWGFFGFRWSTGSLHRGPITTAWGHWLANDKQPRINWSGEVRELAVTKAIVEEAEWTVNETLDPKR